MTFDIALHCAKVIAEVFNAEVSVLLDKTGVAIDVDPNNCYVIREFNVVNHVPGVDEFKKGEVLTPEELESESWKLYYDGRIKDDLIRLRDLYKHLDLVVCIDAGGMPCWYPLEWLYTRR